MTQVRTVGRPAPSQRRVGPYRVPIASGAAFCARPLTREHLGEFGVAGVEPVVLQVEVTITRVA